MSKHTDNNDAATIGIGVKWLHDVLNQQPQRQRQRQPQQEPCRGRCGSIHPQIMLISDGGKMILDQLLKETELHPTNSVHGSRHQMQNVIPHQFYNESSFDDDDDDDDDGGDIDTVFGGVNNGTITASKPTWKFMMHRQYHDDTSYNNNDDDDDDDDDDDVNIADDIQQFCTEERSFFLILLTIIHELCQKQGEQSTTKSHNKVSSLSTSTSCFVSTNEIIKAFHSKECNNSTHNHIDKNNQHPSTKTKKQRRILRASRIPSRLNSNQLIFSTLVFLSQTIPELQHSTTPSKFLNHHCIMNESSSSFPHFYFPTMPLLSIKERNSNNDNSANNDVSIDTKNLYHSLQKIPLGYQINHETIPSMDLLQDCHFIRRLSILESCFWSTSTTSTTTAVRSRKHYYPNNTIQQQDYIPRIHAIPIVGGEGVVSSCPVLSTKEDQEMLLTTGTLKKSTSNAGGSRKGHSQGKKKDTVVGIVEKNGDSSKRKYDDMDLLS